MRIGPSLLPVALLALGACAPAIPDDASTGAPRPIGELPEAVRAAAAPFQDLTSVVLRPEDGCYWYSHAGPVETTLLPLRTVEGRPICTRAPEPLAS